MKGWRIGIPLVFLCCLPVLLAHSTSQGLLSDTDTAFLLKVIRERQAPLSWFSGDWPLQNHFYRPLPTLTFELDSRLYGNNAAGYGWTSAILSALCILALFWLLSELFRSPIWAFAGAAIFSLWNTDRGDLLTSPLLWAAAGLLLVGLYRHSLRFGRFVPASLVLIFLAIELGAPEVTATKSLEGSTIDWLPGRTATVMTLFALVAMASYMRYESAGRQEEPVEPPGSLDVPRNSKASSAPRLPWAWLGICLVGIAGAFASYEQAVMVPAALLGLAVFLRMTGRLPNWRLHILFWALLGAYLYLRHLVIPPGVSGYQAQQFRHGPGVLSDLGMYVLPNVPQLVFVWTALSEGILALTTLANSLPILNFISTVATVVESRRNWRIILTGWALSSLAFLPMAWLKQFGHYHYWPLALRTILILGLARMAWDLVSIASCPPVLRAPPRPAPAPGSLPRP